MLAEIACSPTLVLHMQSWTNQHPPHQQNQENATTFKGVEHIVQMKIKAFRETSEEIWAQVPS